MKLLALVCTATILLVGHARLASAKQPKPGEVTGCEPSRDQVGFFKDKKFGGACVMHEVGSYADAAALGIGRDQLSSVKVGAAVQVVLCRDAKFSGDCHLLAAHEPNLGATRIGNDKVTSAEVQTRGHQDCVPGPKQIALFKHGEFLAPCELREIGEYPEIQATSPLKAAISSIRIGDEVQAVLCRLPAFGGDCEMIVANDNSLIDNRAGNDKTASIKVQPRGLKECVPKADAAGLFQHRDFLAPCVLRNVGDYPNAAALGIADNALSSIRVGSAVQVCACEHESFGGSCSVFVEDAPGVGANIGVISSVRVQTRGAVCQGGKPRQP